MIYTVSVALVCAGCMSAIAAAILLAYRKRVSKAEQVQVRYEREQRERPVL
jgi:hypothetical protein